MRDHGWLEVHVTDSKGLRPTKMILRWNDIICVQNAEPEDPYRCLLLTEFQPEKPLFLAEGYDYVKAVLELDE